MFMNVTCPACGQKSRVPESTFGQQHSCPTCAHRFQWGPPPSSSPVAVPTPDVAPAVLMLAGARAADVPNERGVNFRCPRCAKSLEAPGHLAGQKANCPDCGQRLQIPHATIQPVAVRSVEHPSPAATPAIPVVLPPTAPPVPEAIVRKVVALPAPVAPARRESCLECGKDVTDRPRIQTCPDCGSLFCSAGCYREHRYHAHTSRR